MPLLEPNSPRHPIRIAARRSGVKPDLIRAWERRYRAVEPGRSDGSQRLYSDHDVERLILLRRAVEAGRSIGQVAGLSDEALERLVGEDERPAAIGLAAAAPASLPPSPDPLGIALGAVANLDGPGLARELAEALVVLGPIRLLSELVAPLVQAVGEACRSTRLRPLHEHLATSVVRTFLAELALRQQGPESHPCLLVTTPAGQRHELGALLVAARAACEGWRVVYLGADLPSEEIAAAAAQAGATAVALSLVHPPDDPRLAAELGQLRQRLGPFVPLLVGGAAAPAYSAALAAAQARHLPGLDDLPAALAQARGGRAQAVPARDEGLAELLRRFDAGPPRPATAADGGWPGPRRGLYTCRQARERYGLPGELFAADGLLVLDDLPRVRGLVHLVNAGRRGGEPGQPGVSAAALWTLALLQEAAARQLRAYRDEVEPEVLTAALEWLRRAFGRGTVERACEQLEVFYPASRPPTEIGPATLEKMWLVWLANQNRASGTARELVDDDLFEEQSGYRRLIASLEHFFAERPRFGPAGQDLFTLLRASAEPRELGAQLASALTLAEGLARRHQDRLRRGLDVLAEEQKSGFVAEAAPARAAPPPPPPPRRSWRRAEGPWMERLVVVAKNVKVWLDQLSRRHARPIRRLDEVPAEELEQLASWGFTGLWLVGTWERSPASRKLKQAGGNLEADSSAYALAAYRVAAELGGEAAAAELERRAGRVGLRLVCDFVPNHMGIDSSWVLDHPELFVRVRESPFPSYSFTGEDLSPDPAVGIYLEDHYRDHSDAAVVFARHDRKSGERSYLYHGNDGTSLPWNDTAQLDYANPAVRARMIELLVTLARRFPIIRVDAAMALARQHVQRLWYPAPGQGGAIPSRSEHGLSAEEFDRRMPEEFWREALDRLEAEVPDTLLLAEGFWLLETYFARDLGMHRVYDISFLHDLRDERNAAFRARLRELLRLDPALVGRFVRFLTNPDERPAAVQVGKGDKYFTLTVLLATLPGTPLFGHGQVEGLEERYGMEYRRAYRGETPDAELVARHEREIAPLLARRALFASAAGFRLYDVVGSAGALEDVIAYSNRRGDERAVVLAHNRNREARGRLRLSVPFRSAEDYERVESLGEALGLAAAEGTFYRFRDHVSGQEFLAPGRRFREEGLEVALGPYESRVLLGFDVLEDDGSGRLAALERRLAGRGVHDLGARLAELGLRPVEPGAQV